MADFHLLITDWYRQNSRDLPWRRTNDPYHIWLSEIILQQTRVEQGMSYYLRFVETYPTVVELAAADEEQVLKLWQGLGYYSRARNLHAAAREISTTFGGKFPENYEDIRVLKGIGDYTAAAIASFAFGKPHAVVDGNVYRLLSRYFDIELPIDSTKGKRFFNELAQELLNTDAAAIHNQAIMEMGALVCTPKNPDCVKCPLNSSCLGLQRGTIAIRPVKEKKTSIRERFFYFLIFRQNGQLYLEKRSAKDVWQHLYQFPLLETQGELSPEELRKIKHLEPVRISEEIIHILSHQRIRARFVHFDKPPAEIPAEWTLIPEGNIHDFPLPRLIDRYLEAGHLH